MTTKKIQDVADEILGHLGLAKNEATRSRIRPSLTQLVKEVEAGERNLCKKDACGYCNGNYPQYEKNHSEKPNEASNYIHKKKDGTDEALCEATSIIHRGNFKGEPFEVFEVETTPPTSDEDEVHGVIIGNGLIMEKEIIVKIDENWQRECLESIFGDEDISDIRHDYRTETEYEIECVLRRVIKK